MRAGVLVGVCVCWVSALAAGVWSVEEYSNSPGAGAMAPVDWPTGLALSRSSTQETLLLFLHPKCPCSAASVGELNRLLSRFGAEVETHVFFVVPPGLSGDWANTALYRSALELPDARVQLDLGAEQARRFGAKTSGQALLYSPAGRLLFSGGITAARGHHGDNPGRDLLEQQITAPKESTQRYNVFGCGLFAREDILEDSI